VGYAANYPGIVWRQIYDPDAGALNIMLMDVGLISPNELAFKFRACYSAVVIAGVWGEISKAAVFSWRDYNHFKRPVRGSTSRRCGRWAELWHITLPTLKPVVAAIVSLSFMWNFNTFGLVWVLTQGGPAG